MYKDPEIESFLVANISKLVWEAREITLESQHVSEQAMLASLRSSDLIFSSQENQLYVDSHVEKGGHLSYVMCKDTFWVLVLLDSRKNDASEPVNLTFSPV